MFPNVSLITYAITFSASQRKRIAEYDPEDKEYFLNKARDCIERARKERGAVNSMYTLPWG